MATWDRFHYGPEDRHWGESWIPAGVNGTGAALIYFHGSGFESGWTDLLYDPTSGEDFWLDQILTREASGQVNERTCSFSIMVSQHRYDYTHVAEDGWADVTAYSFGDYVTEGGNSYFCIRAHTSAAANDQPTSGTNWTDYWRLSDKNDLNAKLRKGVGAQTAAYGPTGQMDALLAYNYIVEHAAQFGFDPTKVVIMGQLLRRPLIGSFQPFPSHVRRGRRLGGRSAAPPEVWFEAPSGAWA